MALVAAPVAAPMVVPAKVLVRSFNRATDEKAVRRIFDEGMMGMTSAAFSALVQAVWPLAAAVCALLSAMAWAFGIGPVGAALAALVPLAACLVAVRLSLTKSIRSFVDKSLSADLQDIDSFYMAMPSSHFWVAVGPSGDEAEAVLGCVALEVKSHDDQDDRSRRGWGELRRMSVAKAGRRRGVASLLNAALLAHAKEHQLKGVYLTTSTMQPDAIALYTKLEYQQVSLKPLSLFKLDGVIKLASFQMPL